MMIQFTCQHNQAVNPDIGTSNFSLLSFSVKFILKNELYMIYRKQSKS